MIRLANVLIVDDNASRAGALAQRLAGGGYHATRVAASDGAVAHARLEHPDLILLGADSVSLAADLKDLPETGDIPVIVLAEAPTPDLYHQAFEAGLDEVMALSSGDGELFARLRPLVRLATMHTELRHRATVARRFGVAARERVTAPADSTPAILLIGSEAARYEHLLAGTAEITLSDSLFEAEELLTKRNFDAALLDVASDPDGVLSFCAQVRNNPRLFNLPMVVVEGIRAAEAYKRGATRVLRRDVEPEVLRAIMGTLVRRQQLRWTIRDALNDSLAGGARDPLTGAYTRSYLDAYLAGRLDAAKAQDRHLAVVFFASPNIEGVRRQFGDDAGLHLTQQVGQWITGLLRAEDLTAAYAPGEYCVVLPDTPLAEAEVVMHRIAGVLAYTDFAVREVYQPVKVWVQVGCTDLQNGDDMAALLARARRNLD